MKDFFIKNGRLLSTKESSSTFTLFQRTGQQRRFAAGLSTFLRSHYGAVFGPGEDLPVG